MKIYANKLNSIPVDLDIDVTLSNIVSAADIEASANLEDFNIPSGPVISKDRKRLTQQMISDYECFVDDIETLCEVNYGLIIVYTNESEDYSHYYNYLAKDDEGNIIAKFRFRLRVSNHPAKRTSQQRKNKKSEIDSPELHKLTEEQILKLRVHSKEVIVNDEIFDSYEQAFDYVDKLIERAVEVITR